MWVFLHSPYVQKEIIKLLNIRKKIENRRCIRTLWIPSYSGRYSYSTTLHLRLMRTTLWVVVQIPAAPRNRMKQNQFLSIYSEDFFGMNLILQEWMYGRGKCCKCLNSGIKHVNEETGLPSPPINRTSTKSGHAMNGTGLGIDTPV